MNSRATWIFGAAAVAAVLTAFVVSRSLDDSPAPLQIITSEEAVQPASRGQFTPRRQGPGIAVMLPDTTAPTSSPFPIHVEFTKRAESAPVNMASLKLTYMKLWGIDITDRVRDYISGTTISVPETEIPAGEHTIEIYIEDEDRRISTKQITIRVEPDQ